QSRTTALVTGAAQGIGLGIARSLASASYRVMLADVDESLLQASAASLEAEGHDALAQCLDVTSTGDWELGVAALIERWGRLDVLVNCAGISPRGTAESTDEALWDRSLAINLKGPWLGIKASIPHLKRQRGTIVNIGSTRATRPMPGLCSYI